MVFRRQNLITAVEGHYLFLEDLTFGEQDFIIRDLEVVRDIYQYSMSLWKSEAVIKDKKKVKKLLEEYIESPPTVSVIS